MTDVDVGSTEYWNVIKEDIKFDKEKRLAEFNSTGWHKHTDYHFSKIINGKKLDYYPSTRKFCYNGKTRKGDVQNFINRILGGKS